MKIPWWKWFLIIFLIFLIGISIYFIYQGFLTEVLIAYAITFLSIGIILIFAYLTSKELLFWLVGKRSEYNRILNASQKISVGISNLAIDAIPVILDKEEKSRLKEDVPTFVQMRLMATINNYIARIIVGAFAAGFGLLGTIVLMRQNEKIDLQNQLVHIQNDKVNIQNNLLETDRRSSLIFLMSNILDKVDEEIKSQTEIYKDTLGKVNTPDSIRFSLSSPLIGRIAALSKAFRPYKVLQGDTLSNILLSPERSQLFTALMNIKLNRVSLQNIVSRGNFTNMRVGKIDLIDADFSESDFTNVDFSQANLTRANLQKSNLTRTNFYKADLTGVDLTESNLTDANLSSAILKGSDFRWSTLLNTNLENSDMESANLSWVDFRPVLLKNTNFKNANFSWSNLSERDLTNMIFIGANFFGTNLEKSNLSYSNLHNTNLRGTNFSNANLKEVDLRKVATGGSELYVKEGRDRRGNEMKLVEIVGSIMVRANTLFDNANINGVKFSHDYSDLSTFQENEKNIKIYLDYSDTTEIITIITNRSDSSHIMMKKKLNNGSYYIETKDVGFINNSIERNKFAGANLSKSDFSQLNLRGANFKSANLRNADFRDADLSIVRLQGADIRGALFHRCNLEGSYLSKVKVSSKDWIRALSTQNVKGVNTIKEKYFINSIPHKDTLGNVYYLISAKIPIEDNIVDFE